MPSLDKKCKEELVNISDPWKKLRPPLVISLEVVFVDRGNGEGYGSHQHRSREVVDGGMARVPL